MSLQGQPTGHFKLHLHTSRHFILSALLQQAQSHSSSAPLEYLLILIHEELCHTLPYLPSYKNFLSIYFPKYKGQPRSTFYSPPFPSQDAVMQSQENLINSLLHGVFAAHHSQSFPKTYFPALISPHSHSYNQPTHRHCTLPITGHHLLATPAPFSL